MIQKANELELKLIKTGEAIIQAQADLEAAEEKKEEQYEAMKKRIKLCTNPEQAALQSRSYDIRRYVEHAQSGRVFAEDA